MQLGLTRSRLGKKGDIGEIAVLAAQLEILFGTNRMPFHPMPDVPQEGEDPPARGEAPTASVSAPSPVQGPMGGAAGGRGVATSTPAPAGRGSTTGTPSASVRPRQGASRPGSRSASPARPVPSVGGGRRTPRGDAQTSSSGPGTRGRESRWLARSNAKLAEVIQNVAHGPDVAAAAVDLPKTLYPPQYDMDRMNEMESRALFLSNGKNVESLGRKIWKFNYATSQATFAKLFEISSGVDSNARFTSGLLESIDEVQEQIRTSELQRVATAAELQIQIQDAYHQVQDRQNTLLETVLEVQRMMEELPTRVEDSRTLTASQQELVEAPAEPPPGRLRLLERIDFNKRIRRMQDRETQDKAFYLLIGMVIAFFFSLGIRTTSAHELDPSRAGTTTWNTTQWIHFIKTGQDTVLKPFPGAVDFTLQPLGMQWWENSYDKATGRRIWNNNERGEEDGGAEDRRLEYWWRKIEEDTFGPRLPVHSKQLNQTFERHYLWALEGRSGDKAGPLDGGRTFRAEVAAELRGMAGLATAAAMNTAQRNRQAMSNVARKRKLRLLWFATRAVRLQQKRRFMAGGTDPFTEIAGKVQEAMAGDPPVQMSIYLPHPDSLWPTREPVPLPGLLDPEQADLDQVVTAARTERKPGSRGSSGRGDASGIRLSSRSLRRALERLNPTPNWKQGKADWDPWPRVRVKERPAPRTENADRTHRVAQWKKGPLPSRLSLVLRKEDLLFQGYDCSNPYNLQTVQSSHLPECEKPQGPLFLQNVTFQVFQKAARIRVPIKRCRAFRSRTFHYCGVYDHSTPLTSLWTFRQPYPLSITECNAMWSSGWWKDAAGHDHQVKANHTTFLHSPDLGYTEARSNQIKCHGGNLDLGDGVVIPRMYAASYYEIELTASTGAILPEEGTISDSESYDGGELPCLAREKVCITNKGTYVWEEPTEEEACPLFLIREPAVKGVLTEEPQDGFSTLLSTDGSMIRLTRGPPHQFCGSEVRATQFPQLFTMLGHTDNPLLQRQLHIQEMSPTLYTNGKDDFITNHILDYVDQVVEHLRSDACESRQELQSTAYAELAARQKVLMDGETVSLGGGHFGTAAGEVWYTYYCRQIPVVFRETGQCYSALPVNVRPEDRAVMAGRTARPVPLVDGQGNPVRYQKDPAGPPLWEPVNVDEEGHRSDVNPLDDVEYFLEPKTSRLITQAASFPCTPPFLPTYRNAKNRWISFAPEPKPAPDPEALTTPFLERRRKESREPLNHGWGGFYTAPRMAAMDDWRSRVTGGTLIATQLYTQARGATKYHINGALNNYDLFPNALRITNLSPLQWFCDFFEEWGTICAGILGFLCLLFCLYTLINLVCYCQAPAVSKRRSVNVIAKLTPGLRARLSAKKRRKNPWWPVAAPSWTYRPNRRPSDPLPDLPLPPIEEHEASAPQEATTAPRTEGSTTALLRRSKALSKKGGSKGKSSLMTKYRNLRKQLTPLGVPATSSLSDLPESRTNSPLPERSPPRRRRAPDPPEQTQSSPRVTINSSPEIHRACSTESIHPGFRGSDNADSM